MEWVLVIVAVVALLWFGMGAVINAAKRQQEADPDRVLNEWFDGREQVIVKQGPSTLSAEAILSGANDRGYRLISAERMAYPNNNAQQMVFERKD